jgi:hypothetical protein
MPTITRTLIKTALVYLLAGTFLSALWLVQIVVPLHPFLAVLQPTALHLIVVGWLTQLIFGVALWMFPIRSKAQPRGPEAFGWSCYGLLNAGLVLRLIAEPLQSFRPIPALGWVLVLSAVLQVAACWIFVGLIWTRVRVKPARG